MAQPTGLHTVGQVIPHEHVCDFQTLDHRESSEDNTTTLHNVVEAIIVLDDGMVSVTEGQLAVMFEV